MIVAIAVYCVVILAFGSWLILVVFFHNCEQILSSIIIIESMLSVNIQIVLCKNSNCNYWIYYMVLQCNCDTLSLLDLFAPFVRKV